MNGIQLKLLPIRIVFLIHKKKIRGGKVMDCLSDKRLRQRMFLFDTLGIKDCAILDQIIDFFREEYGYMGGWSGLSKTRRKQLYVEKSGKCFYCLKKIGLQEMTIEHVIPRSCGGVDDESNYEIVCWQCNQEKAAELSSIIRHLTGLSTE